ncbi:Lrp/AsnC family transcriptional regulator [Halobacterium sp. R2-5]|uniref:Lrp/AsnC family transcriptional regulator n=1 Tax=Halobacterium sp. R2-5 TaxID=2715751 RepID=UPI00141F5E22|nr:Lrp/AsnC family transcriptional regulator [Halobacterium sp. R2-5]NIB99836.1 Lrp/AsnC family transcriptional regulator [Halobacterium sp. R2-5]
MSPDDLDRIDKGILYLLQQDARKHTTTEIGEKVGVSSSTVANRINNLEERDVITGYHPIIEYEQTGMGHHLLVLATVPLTDQAEIIDELVSVPGVVSVRELLSNNRNLSIELVGKSKQDIEKSVGELDSLGVDIERMEMLKKVRQFPYNHFGKEYTTETEDG